MLAPGSIFIEKYRIDRQLGEGGMGVVLAATHLQLDDRVAIKLLRADMVTRPDVVDRFLHEAQSSVRLKSEHVARIFDVGVAPDGVPYIVMEYLEGRDLNALFRARGALPAGELVDYVLQACEAMAEAHAQAIVHRDIKPANLFVTRRPDGSPLVKVLDFGISKALDRDLQLTSSQAMLGTPAYMSPEQLRASREVDTRTDIWSLGVLLYELLCGHQPFDAPSFGELVLQVVTTPAPPLPVDSPRGIAAVVARCLERERDKRYRSVADLAAALAPFASNRQAGELAAARTASILRHSLDRSLDRSLDTGPVAFDPGAPTTLGTGAGAVAHSLDHRSRRGWIVGGVAAGRHCRRRGCAGHDAERRRAARASDAARCRGRARRRAADAGRRRRRRSTRHCPTLRRRDRPLPFPRTFAVGRDRSPRSTIR